jgi:anti-anti-sigma regulatory factor
MIVPVFTPPPRIDAAYVAEFARTVSEHVARYRSMVIDCSEVEWITGVGMHVLEMASSDAPITLVNPNPAVHLMAATFGGDVQCPIRPDVDSGSRARSATSAFDVGTRRRESRIVIGSTFPSLPTGQTGVGDWLQVLSQRRLRL